MDSRQLDRLRWRCRRGLLELDLALGNFLDERYAKLSVEEQGAFERLLALPDATLHAYLQGLNPPTEEFEQIVRKIRQ